MIPEDFARLLEVAKHRIAMRTKVRELLLPLPRTERLALLLDLAVDESEGNTPPPLHLLAPSGAVEKGAVVGSDRGTGEAIECARANGATNATEIAAAIAPMLGGKHVPGTATIEMPPQSVGPVKRVAPPKNGKPNLASKDTDYTGHRIGTFIGSERVGTDGAGRALWHFLCSLCGEPKTWSTRTISVALKAGHPPHHVCRSALVAPKPASEPPAPPDAPIRAPAPPPSSEVAKPAPAKVPPAIDPGLLGESIRSLVRNTAARIAVQHGADRSELMRVGMQAAERAANQWNPATGQPLVTYANKIIREAMVEHARKAPDSDDEDALLARSMAEAADDVPGKKGWHTATHRLPPGSEDDEREGDGEDEEEAE